jgi:hypothetical protein
LGGVYRQLALSFFLFLSLLLFPLLAQFATLLVVGSRPFGAENLHFFLQLAKIRLQKGGGRVRRCPGGRREGATTGEGGAAR